MNLNATSQLWSDKGNKSLTFGFDIGMASVGWAVLSENRIIAAGVRCFDRAEDERGKPLNEHRRLMKTQRNRLKRRALRLKRLRRLLRDAGAVSAADHTQFDLGASDPWSLRAAGLDRKLEPGEWARVLYHLVKHRGFFAARKTETLDESTEGGKLTQGVRRTAGLLGPPDARRYRTLGELAAHDEAFAQAKRNKAGSYINSFARSLLGDELGALFEAQGRLGNPHASTELRGEVTRLFWQQKPPITGPAMLAMIGRCNFEPAEYRAPKCSYSAERFVWLSKLNNLRVLQDGRRRPLTEAERAAVRDLPYVLKEVSYKQLRDKLCKECGFPANWQDAGFAGLSYRASVKRNKKGEILGTREADEVEAKPGGLIRLRAWHETRRVLFDAGLESTWRRISGEPATLDAVALALSIYKSDEEIRDELAKLVLSPTETEALLGLDFKDFLRISLKAISRLMPHLERGLRYDEACALPEVGYDHAQPGGESSRTATLPPIDYDNLRNPVVFRALHQARKVLNELVRVHGSPCAVHIELARDLSKSFEERMDIRKGQEAYQEEREEAIRRFREDLGRDPNPKEQDVLKYRLYNEQGGQCAYTQRPIDLARLTEQGYVEIDHVLPYSRSFDDSQNNKVLVLAAENQNKGNRTPFEYLNGENDADRWRNFEAWVRGHKNFRKAKRERLLRRSFTAEEAEGFKSRNLNDTRYITRFFAGFVRSHLAFAPNATGEFEKVPVLCPTGAFTSFLRARWGLLKDREASDLHHALDACVVAAASPALIKRISDFARMKELVQLPDGTFADAVSGEVVGPEAAAALAERFPKPWPQFREEVLARLSTDPLAALGAAFSAYDTSARNAVKPVFVSRAVKRRPAGPVHQDTVRSIAAHLGRDRSSKRVPLPSLKLAMLPDIVGAHDGRNAALIAALRARLEAHGNDGKKAFAEPVHKPRRDGTAGPLVRAVQVASAQKGGVRVRGGIAGQASMWRVDVFEKGGKFHLVPIYQADRRKGGLLPNRAVVAYAARDEWTEMDPSHTFRFSLFPNDLVCLKTKKGVYFGYFSGLDVSTGAVNIATPQRDIRIGKGGVWESLGVKVGVESFEKLHVDVLGNFHRARPELRGGLA